MTNYRATDLGLLVPVAAFQENISAGDRRTLSGEIATRKRSLDAWSFANWLPNPDPVLKALGRDIAVYRDLRSDAHVGGAVRRRKAAVKTLEQELDRRSARARVHASIEDLLEDIDISRLIVDALDGALFGYQPLEILWARVGDLLVPERVIGKPAEWFVYSPENELRFRSREAQTEGEELPERKVLVARNEPSYQNPYGIPDLSLVFWPTTFKKGGLKFWVNFTQKYGTDKLFGRLPRSAAESEYDDMLDKLAAMIEDAVAVIPDDSSVEMLTATGKAESVEAYERLLMFCRSEVSIALLGSNLAMETDATRASATAGIDVARDIRDADAAMVEDVVNQLIQWVVELNWPNSAAPLWSLREQQEIDQEGPKRDKMLVDAGVKFTRQYWLDTYGLQDEDLEAEQEAETPPAGGQTLPPPGTQDATADLADGGAPAIGEAELRRLDQAVTDAELQQDLDPALLPLIQAIVDDPERAMGALAEIHPEMDSRQLEDRLARYMFVAELWGRLVSEQEAQG